MKGKLVIVVCFVSMLLIIKTSSCLFLLFCQGDERETRRCGVSVVSASHYRQLYQNVFAFHVSEDIVYLIVAAATIALIIGVYTASLVITLGAYRLQWLIFSLLQRDSTPRFVGPSVSPSVHPSVRHTLLFWRI